MLDILLLANFLNTCFIFYFIRFKKVLIFVLPLVENCFYRLLFLIIKIRGKKLNNSKQILLFWISVIYQINNIFIIEWFESELSNGVFKSITRSVTIQQKPVRIGYFIVTDNCGAILRNCSITHFSFSDSGHFWNYFFRISPIIWNLLLNLML